MAQASVVQPCEVTHSQMQHQEPAFHEELDLLMSPESGSGISHTGDGWTRAPAPYQGTWRNEAEQPDCLWLRQPQVNFRKGPFGFCLLPVSAGWGVCLCRLRAAAAENLALRSSQKLGSQPKEPDAQWVQVPSGPGSSWHATVGHCCPSPRRKARPVLETTHSFLSCRTGQVDLLLPFVRFSWGGGEVGQSCVTSQTVVHATQKQALTELSGADASAGCCPRRCRAPSMLSSCRGEKNFPWHRAGGCSPHAPEDAAVPMGCPSTEQVC